ncbi:MAG TPA: hypothetical protein VFA93_01950 [Patescibacteria group bacterium]|nr:hypothetical protein [Patescibacteria group bacterium]
MTATSHALIGTIIAAKVGNPALAIPLALASHFAADMVPHWDVATNSKDKGTKRVLIDATLDVIVGFLLSYSLIVLVFPHTNLIYAFFLIIIAQLPDWFFCPYYFFNLQWKISRWAYNFGKRTNMELDKPWGIISQIAVISLLVYLAKNF